MALGSKVLHRLEVAAAAFTAVDLLGMVLVLAWRGEFVRRVELPGGGAIEGSGAFERGAEDFEAFRRATDERLTGIEDAVAALDERTSSQQ